MRAGWHRVTAALRLATKARAVRPALSLRFSLLLFLPRRLAFFGASPGASTKPAPKKPNSHAPHQLDRGITWHRDLATGELGSVIVSEHAAQARGAGRSFLPCVTQMVPVTCIVSPRTAPVPGLRRERFPHL